MATIREVEEVERCGAEAAMQWEREEEDEEKRMFYIKKRDNRSGLTSGPHHFCLMYLLILLIKISCQLKPNDVVANVAKTTYKTGLGV